jgi:DNA repair exonuclease SbcCD ATPase subunit
MKIIELRAENIKNLKVVEIKADDVNILTGKNGAGKSAILDSIMMALTGKKIEKPIREGETHGEIVIDLGQYKVKRVYTENSDRLEVLSPDGAKYPSPQSLLNTITGNISFDPLSFARMEKTEQRKFLVKLIGLDLSVLENKKTNIYNDRTIKNKELKSLESQLSAMTAPDKDISTTEISWDAELKKVDELENKKRKYDNAVSEQTKLINLGKDIGNKILQLDKQIEELNKQKETYQNQTKKINEEIQLFIIPEVIIQEQIDNAKSELKTIEQKNIKIRDGIKFNILKTNVDSKKVEVVNLSKEMDTIEQEKTNTIKNSKFPLDGLSINDESVLFNNTPLSQLSTAEQIKISTAIAIELNPKLEVIFIRDGSLLDNDSFKNIVEMAKLKGRQIWIEKMSEGKGVGIYIEAGEIK